MSSYINFGFGIQRLIDAQQVFTRHSHPTWLRLRNFPDVQNQQWAQMGFSITPSGSLVGTIDILITPQPSWTMISLHNIGQSEGKLRFGARQFMISETFVQAQAAAQGLTDESLVWRGSNVVGLITDNLLFSIEDYTHEEVANQTIAWFLTCNSNELK